MTDKRRYKRFSVDVLGINGKMMFASEVEIHDISLGGMSLKVDRRLNMGNEYTLKIGNNQKTVTVKGAVVWSKISGSKKGSRDEVIPLYTAGMKFVNMSGDKIKELTSFLDGQANFSHEKMHQASGLRCSMRFLVDPPLRKAVIKLPETYLVKKLSLGGMLVESEGPFQVEEKIPMEMVLPGDITLRFIGRIASSLMVHDEGALRYDIGIEFIEIQEDSKKRLEEFIHSLDTAQGISR
jgi:c-di-GMP-binding flagellar brake protein YcgR